MISSSQQDGITIVQILDSRLDAENAPQFRSGFAALVEGGSTRVVLDFKDVEFVDSSGIGALVSALKRLGGRGDLIVSGLRPAVRRAFSITRMDKVFSIAEDTQSAVNKLREIL